MELLLTISDLRSNVTHNVVLTASSNALFEEVEPLLTQFIDRQASWQFNGRRLRADDPLVEVGLCDGVVLQAAEPSAGPDSEREDPTDGTQRKDAVGYVRVLGGPDAGSVWPLRAGTYIIGRSKATDLTLASDNEVSRQHARLKITTEGITIEDLSSSNGTIVAGVSITEPTPLLSGEVVELGDSLLSVSLASGVAATVVQAPDGTRIFNRPPRITTRSERFRITVPSPPGDRQRGVFSIVGIVLPLVVGGAMAFVNPLFLLFALMSPAMAVSTYVSDRRRGTRSHQSAVAQFQERKAEYIKALDTAIDRETQALRSESPDPTEIAAIAETPLVRLWERRREDGDFLALRLGLADLPSSVELTVTTRSDSPKADSQEQPVLHQVPVSLRLDEVGILGLAGGADDVAGLARWLVVQLATLHAPDDVRLVVLGAGDAVQPWDWSIWLPHLRMNEGTSTASISSNDDGITQLANQLAATVDGRFQTRDVTRTGDPDRNEPSIVVILGAAHRMRAIPAVARILKLGPAVGVYCICLADAPPQLPEECRAVGTFPMSERVQLDIRLPDGSTTAAVVADRVSAEWAQDVSRSLAPLRLDRQHESSAGLPGSLALLDLLGLQPPTVDAVAAGWATSRRTAAATIGASANGPLVLDLHRDGPHGLVAGTTGSGKSELLLTLIASLAVANRPDALNFVLIDYKGGSAFSACARLPHTVGMVTDLDGHLTERALTSLAAELRRRERLFRDAGANDIDDYWRIFERAPASSPRSSIARIVIVIDEFASLLEELPEFVDGLVDLARRGRSLGIHLILATQRPTGVVSPAIKTNTNLRIAMRVTDATDSMDVINSQLAARVAQSTPGRGFVRIGHEQLVEFQAARVKGRRRALSVKRTRPLLRMLTPETLAAPPPQVLETDSEDDQTDLDVLVQAVVGASGSLGIDAPASPWLPGLPDSLLLSDLHPAERTTGMGPIPFGLEDLPAQQARAVAVLDLELGSHLIVAGDAGSGRSTLLRTIAASAASSIGPTDLHLYAIDCGNGALLPLVEFPHCGAVVSRTEVERTDRLITKLLADIEYRQRVLAGGGFSNLADQRASASSDERLPYVLVLLDRWEGFTSSFESVDGGRLVTSFQHLLREGPGAGLRIVLTGDRTVLVGRMATMAEFRLALRLNDRSSYSLAGLNPHNLPDEIHAGRAFRADSGRELQVALLSPDSSGPGQVAAMREIAERSRRAAASIPETQLPEPVATIPSYVELATVLGATDAESGQPLSASIGVGGNRLERVEIDLTTDGPGYVVMGPRRSGRSNTLVALARSLAASGGEVIGIVTVSSPLQTIAGNSGVIEVLQGRSANPEDLTAALARARGPATVLVDDIEHLLDSPLATALEGVLRSAREQHRAVVIAGGIAEINAASFRGLIAEVKKSRAGLLLSPGASTDGELLGLRLPKTALFTGPAGRALRISNGSRVLVQIADTGQRV